MRRKAALLLAAVLLIGLPLLTKASEERNSSIKSSGNIIYKSSDGSVELYAEDIALLQERLASVPDEIFSPVLYSHSHSWEYFDITSKSHTKHCAECGDVIEKHKASIVSSCTISYGEKEYLGYKKSCKCGYEWEEEQFHNIVYESKNDSSHTLSCALSGTLFCSGMDSLEEEHSMMSFAMDQSYHMESCAGCGFTNFIKKEHSMIYYATDESHHMESCAECDLEGEEQECSFDEEVTEEDQEETRKYCKCGNYITESSSDGSEPIPEVSDPDGEESNLDDLTKKVSEGGAL